MADKRISELPAAESLESTDLMMVAQENVSSLSGYVSMKTTAADVADEFNTELTYSGLNTTSKTVVGAINEVKSTAEGMVEANPAGSAFTALNKIKIGNTTYEIEDTGSIVSVFQTLGTGTEIGSVIVDNVETKFYAPTPTEVTANPQGTSSIDLEKISIGGSIYNIPSGGSQVGDLDDLSNVTITTPTDGQVLKYNDSTHEWVNAAESGGGSSTLTGLTDTSISSPAADQDLSYDSTSSKWINKTHRVELTKAQYDALPSSKLTDGIEYFITDMETTGVEIVANPEDTATDTLTKLQIGDDVYNISGGGSASWTDITGTLTAGQTSISFTDSSISESSTFDFYTSKFGVNPIDVELVNSAYNFTEFMNGKIVVREHKTDTTDKKLFFIGLEKDATDIDVTDTSLLEYLSDITNDYKKASYSYSDGTTRNGNIGFYNLGNGIKLRSWVINWTQTLAGTFYGMIDLNEAPSSASSTEGQTNTYSDPYDVEGGYSVTLTFDEQSTDLDVKIRVTNETN